MPSVFTLEGADLGEPPKLWTTEAAEDLTARLQRLPFMHRPPVPGLGTSDVYFTYGTPLGPHVDPIGPARPPIRIFDASEFAGSAANEYLRKRNPLVAAGMVFAASVIVSFAVGSAAIWGLHRAGYRPE